MEKFVQTQLFENLPTGNHSYTVNTNQLPSGIYFCQVQSNFGIGIVKMIKL